jgi:hypothetical protein
VFSRHRFGTPLSKDEFKRMREEVMAIRDQAQDKDAVDVRIAEPLYMLRQDVR